MVNLLLDLGELFVVKVLSLHDLRQASQYECSASMSETYPVYEIDLDGVGEYGHLIDGGN